MIKGFEKIWISFGNIFNSETSSNSMIFMREDKMTSSNYMKYELGVSKDQIQSLFEFKIFPNEIQISSKPFSFISKEEVMLSSL